MRRVIVYDVGDDSPAGRWWGPGAALFAATSGARVVKAKSVDHMLNQLLAMSWLAGAQVEVWCHAFPGYLTIGGERLNRRDVLDDDRVALLGAKLGPTGTFWIRGCSAFAGPIGHAYAGVLADRLGCRVAGHTFLIGPLQGGLRTLRPQETPTWDPKEGEAGGEWGQAHTTWSTPNRIFALQSRIPEGW